MDIVERREAQQQEWQCKQEYEVRFTDVLRVIFNPQMTCPRLGMRR